MSDTDTEPVQRELPHGDHERIVATARGLVTNDLMIADLERREWVIALTMMVDKLAEYSNLGLILVPFAPHASMPWINGIAPGMVMQCQCVASEDIDALRIECERMYQALHPLSPPEEGTTMTREQEEYEDIPGIDPRLLDPDEEGEPDDDDE